MNGGLNLSIKRAKPNNAGPVIENSTSVVPKGTKQSNKKQTCQEARRQKPAATALETNQPNTKDKGLSSSTAEAVIPSTSTLKKTNDDSKDITRDTPAEKILERFQSRDLTSNEWNKLADQVLTRGVQKAAEDILKSTDREGDCNINAPQDFQMSPVTATLQCDEVNGPPRIRYQAGMGILISIQSSWSALTRV